MTNNTAFELPITPQIQVSGWAGERATPGGGPELPVFYPATGQKISVVIEDDAKILIFRLDRREISHELEVRPVPGIVIVCNVTIQVGTRP